jgi:hypothetical protein
VESQEGVVKAKKIAQGIFERKDVNIERVILGQLKGEPPVVEVVFP